MSRNLRPVPGVKLPVGTQQLARPERIGHRITSDTFLALRLALAMRWLLLPSMT